VLTAAVPELAKWQDDIDDEVVKGKVWHHRQVFGSFEHLSYLTHDVLIIHRSIR
jgi:hypothetical protein